MRALIQRVQTASVTITGDIVASIDKGLVVFVGVEKNDTQSQADRLLEKILNYRVFSDEQGKMNLSLKQVEGGLLLVSQFTLVADTDKGLRPSFSSAASPQGACELYEYLLAQANKKYKKVQSGVFAADMKVSLINDGPVTFLLGV